MAMTLRLSEEETDALRRRAELEDRSMQDVARRAIAQYVSDRPSRLADAIASVAADDAELLHRLSQ
jgi:predicted transcriptional regulator